MGFNSILEHVVHPLVVEQNLTLTTSVQGWVRIGRGVYNPTLVAFPLDI